MEITMNIAIGTDHRGFEHKEAIKERFSLPQKSINWIDVGAYDSTRSDYPIFAKRVCEVMKNGQAEYGVLICGTGVGMAIAANRFAGIYAALVWNEAVARESKECDKANVLVLPADFISLDEAITLVQVWLTAEFKGGRYQERIDQIDSFDVL